MRFPIPFNRHVIVVASAVFLTGSLTGAGITYFALLDHVQTANQTSRSLLTVTKSQSLMLANLQLEAPLQASSRAPALLPLPSSSPSSAVQPSVAPVSPPAVEVASSVQVAQPASVPKPAAAAQLQVTATDRSAARASAKPPASPPTKSSKEVPEAVRPSTARETPPSTVATHGPAVARSAVAPANNAPPSPAPAQPANVISMEKAGISGIDTAGVRFASGREVNVGGTFPNGEVLVSVNPVEGRIVTDSRVILIAKPAQVK